MPGRRVYSGQRPRTNGASEDEVRWLILVEVAMLYYEDGFNQEQIARQIGRSVSTVSRLLAEAEASDIVEIRVRQPTPVALDLQAALIKRFGLRLARVLRTSSDEPHLLLPHLGGLAARYLSTLLTDGAVIGVVGSASVYEVVRVVNPGFRRDIRVAQALGSVGSQLPAIDSPFVTRTLAERVGGTPSFLPAPMIVESEKIHDALVQDPQLRETLSLARRSDIALVGIGAADPRYSTVHRAGYVDIAMWERVRATGAVGDVLADFVDLYGRVQDVGIGRRVVGLRLADLRKIPTVIAVAGGIVKAPAIMGALRTGLIHVLVTDDETARRVLDLADTYPDELVSPDGTSQLSSGG